MNAFYPIEQDSVFYVFAIDAAAADRAAEIRSA